MILFTFYGLTIALHLHIFLKFYFRLLEIESGQFFLLLIVFGCPAYGVAKIKYECVKNKNCSQAIGINALLISDEF